MIFIFFEYNWTFFLIIFFSLILVTTISYFRFNRKKHTEKQKYFNNYLNLLVENIKLSLDKILGTLFINENHLLQTSTSQSELNLKHQNLYKKCQKMSSFERRQSFIKHSQEEKKRRKQKENSDSFFYSSIFSFTKTLIGYNKNQSNKPKNDSKSIICCNNEMLKNPIYLSNNLFNVSKFDYNLKYDHHVNKQIKPILEEEEKNYESINQKNIDNIDENKNSDNYEKPNEFKNCSIKILQHQTSSGSSNSSTPADLFSAAEKGRVGTKICTKQITNDNYTNLNQNNIKNNTQNNENLNREYLMHQLNPNQYHRMQINKNNKFKRQNSEKNYDYQNKIQNSSKTDSNLTCSSSNSSCSECESLDTEEELTLPFIKTDQCKTNISFCKRDSFKIYSNDEQVMQSLIKQCSTDSNDAMTGLLNENLINRQFSNMAYSKLNQKNKQILGRRLTAQNSFTTSGSSFNNSSNNSSFDKDDNSTYFNNQKNINNSLDLNQFNYSYSENNLNSNDSSESSCSTHIKTKIKQKKNSKYKKSEKNEKSEKIKYFQLKNESSIENNKISKIDEELIKNDLEVTHAYDPTSRKLIINILKVQYPFGKKNTQINNFYVKAILYPNRRHNFKTSSKLCINGVAQFNEKFFFNRISSENIISLSIKYTVYSEDNNHKRKAIGEGWVQFANKKPLQQEEKITLRLNKGFDTKLNTNNYLLKHKSKTAYTALNRSVSHMSHMSHMCHSDIDNFRHSLNLNLPELLLGLAYNPTTGRLQVGIIRGSQFKANSNNKPPDTFVKCTLMSSAGNEIGRSKTILKRAQPNPVYKQTFAFQVALFQLPDVSLIITVYNKKSMNRKETIGWFSLGCKSSTDEESAHWNEMRDSKGEQICRWHILSET